MEDFEQLAPEFRRSVGEVGGQESEPVVLKVCEALGRRAWRSVSEERGCRYRRHCGQQ